MFSTDPSATYSVPVVAISADVWLTVFASIVGFVMKIEPAARGGCGSSSTWPEGLSVWPEGDDSGRCGELLSDVAYKGVAPILELSLISAYRI